MSRTNGPRISLESVRGAVRFSTETAVSRVEESRREKIYKLYGRAEKFRPERTAIRKTLKVGHYSTRATLFPPLPAGLLDEHEMRGQARR